MTLQKRIQNYSDMFESKKREDGSTFLALKDGSDEKLQDSVHAAHGDRLPNDWIFGTYAALMHLLIDYDIKSMDDIENYRYEIVDSCVDIYTSDLTEWLNSDNRNVQYITQVLEEGNPKDGIELLAMAQYTAVDEVMSEIISLLSE